ncbi:hypothetical protein HXX76_005632 [Chlamydomonas incerta]|uniref:Uncharacterized protein n=1 Tax=Chlamydomonas incerta TaxID=51695 RepID=A0A835T815_CHLIN|nr:hypothetical protein HXX76_005632 [Chlamydomonas incerta]|eukprot:KAG2438018.1 hypothetical protein HXX76_005632 [Chlamydomonas incerta]
MLVHGLPLALVVVLLLTPDVVPGALSKYSGGSGARSTTTTTTTAGRTATITKYPYTSYGASNPVRITAIGIGGAYILYGGHSYPTTRVIYDQSNTDDCALRNATAEQLGGNDFDIDRQVVDRSLPLVINETTGRSVLEFNSSLYNRTGLIVDPDYCNYTRYGSAGGGGSAARAPVLLALAMGTLAAMWMAGGGRTRCAV